MAVNSILLKIETSNFQEMLVNMYTAVHIEKNAWLCIMFGVGMPWKRQKFI